MPAAPTDKVVVVTGTARGIGLEWANQYSKDSGTFVVALVRKLPTTDGLQRLAGENFVILPGDLSDIASFQNLAAQIAELSGGRIDTLIHNAATMIDAGGRGAATIADSSVEEWQRTFLVNTSSPLLLTVALLPQLRAGKEKRIVFTSSFLATQKFHHDTNGTLSYASYSASKAALNIGAVRVHYDLKAEGFTVITLNPGSVKSDLDTEGKNLEGGLLEPYESVSRMKPFVDSLIPAHSGKDYSLEGSLEMLVK